MNHSDKRKKTQLVIGITALTMIVEVLAGYMTGSMALLADGWHMASHVGALGIAWVGYYLIDQSKFRSQFTFGGGKILILGGYTSAALLLVTAVWMISESFIRFYHPEPIQAQEAMIVAVIGLIVNLVSALILQSHGHDHHHHDHDHKHHHHHDHKHHHHHDHKHHHHHDHDHESQDLNMAGAYAHVLADALTSVLALVALGMAKWKGWLWADPAVGILGALMIIKWGVGLLRQSAHQLLDGNDSGIETSHIQKHLEGKGLSVACIHAWRVDSDKTAVHVRAFSTHYKSEELPKLRSELMHLFPIGHLVIEIGPQKDDCQL
ncbi:MAG: CDF family Co(II)/Ni(II) efflux transporter DmeF [Bacteriovoracaceae bacterium]|nr:CDF family Co(II)/Ni(II) efflux transporter DmeF [Bacteriovoracaceae bacterium]